MSANSGGIDWGAVIRSPRVLIGGAIVLAIIGCALFAPWLAPNDPEEQNLISALLPPAWVDGGESQFPLGTDSLGRCLLSRLFFGARVAIYVAVVAAFGAMLLGGVLAQIAGYFGGVTGALLNRLTEAFLALPFILMALALVSALGPGLWNIIIVMILTNWARYARLVRSEVISIKERDFVMLARIAGVSRVMIALRHVLPNAFNSVAILAVLDVGRAMMLESALSFLGLGVQPPSVSWGVMLADAKSFMGFAWWLALFPGLVIFLSVLSFSALGDWLQSRLDPRSGL